MARDNRTLGKFQLIGLPPAPRGIPQIEVTFDIDANGIVNVTAKDLGTGKQQAITITASSGLSKDEVERMTKDADAHLEEDRRRREEVEARNQADAMVYNVEKLLSENRQKISEADAAEIEAAIKDTKDALETGKPAAEINRLVDRLTKATHKLAEVMYQQAAQAPPSGSGTGTDGSRPSSAAPTAKEGEVIDAEYVDVDEEKKGQ
jgi:molecular chaperone DnaK